LTATPNVVYSPALRNGAPRLFPESEVSDQRGRLTEAMVWVSATHGYAAASVARVGQRAGTSRRTFYTHFANREECFIAALEQGFALLHDALAACCADQDTSVTRLQAAAWEVICLIEDEPKLTRMCVVEALAAGPAALEARRRALDRLAALIQEPSAAGRPTIARALLGAGLDRLHDELTSPAARIDPVELYRQIAYPCLVLIAGPAAAGELALQPPPPRLTPLPREQPSEPQPARRSVTSRLERTLAFLAANPGVANTELQRELDIAHPSQISRYLHNLRNQGLVVAERDGRRRSWSLTVAGHQLLESTATPAR
jgi:AcrR family transcriptional regulator/predicted transcriptional regulator